MLILLKMADWQRRSGFLLHYICNISKTNEVMKFRILIEKRQTLQ